MLKFWPFFPTFVVLVPLDSRVTNPSEVGRDRLVFPQKIDLDRVAVKDASCSRVSSKLLYLWLVANAFFSFSVPPFSTVSMALLNHFWKWVAPVVLPDLAHTHQLPGGRGRHPCHWGVVLISTLFRFGFFG